MRHLCRGNVAVVKGALLAGCRAFYGYPITPASEIAEAAALYLPQVGGVFLQAESEVAAINMVYGAASASVRAMTASSGPGLSLMQEGISYLAGAELPGVIVDVMRGGPGLGNIAPEQSDYFALVKGGGHLGQAAMLMPGTGDFPPGTTSPFLLQPGAGARARLPFFQVRAAASPDNWFGLGRPATLGASVHYGRARVSTAGGDRESDSFAAALDWNLPLVPHTTLAGEAFFGRNLAGFQGGVFQGINTDFAFRTDSVLVPGGPRAIGTRGGWAQLGFTPPGVERLTFYAGYGLDDPRDEDLVSVPARDFRLRNQAFLFSFLHKPSAQLSWGLEFRRLETHFRQSGKRTNNHVNFGITLSFGP